MLVAGVIESSVAKVGEGSCVTSIVMSTGDAQLYER